MVLVVVIAIFLHAKLTKGANEKRQLSGEKQTLTRSLESMATELDAASSRLSSTSEKLEVTQKERDQLQQQLIDKLNHISQLVARLDLASEETLRLDTERQAAAQARDSLAKERDRLLAQRVALARERDSLTASKSTLHEQLDAVTRELAAKVAALEDLAAQRARLAQQAEELNSIVTALKQKIESLNIDLDETQERSATEIAAAESRIQELEMQLAAEGKQAEDYLAQLKRATMAFQGLSIEKQQLQKQLTEVEQLRQKELLDEARHNRELLGLQGPMENVAVLFDASGSMQLAAAGAGSDRWAEAQEIAATWLQHLNVRQCVLIVFSSDVRTFPADGSLADLRGENGKARRESLLQQVQAITPGGWTNTYGALQKAYEYDIDTILLLSDGAPSKSDTGRFDAALAQQIYNLCREHRDIPINTIGLGNYFDKDMSTFLRTVASITGGTFRGE
jgi:uncharacterized coiled-coil DUF342 family protein